MNVLIADGRPIVRRGLRDLLAKLEGCSVVIEASAGYEAIELAESKQPDVILIEPLMLDIPIGDCLRSLKQRAPRSLVLILSRDDASFRAQQCLDAGADGYVVENRGLEVLTAALRMVSRGEQFIDTPAHGVVRRNTLQRLSNREREVLYLIANGYTTPKIAAKLGITRKTVSSYRAQLMTKLDLHNVASLTRFAVLYGLVNVDEPRR